MSDPRTEAGRQFVKFDVPCRTDEPWVVETVLAIEAEAAALDVERLARLVDEAIFDLPIGNDVTYSRGYSAGIAAARESFREVIAALAATPRG